MLPRYKPFPASLTESARYSFEFPSANRTEEATSPFKSSWPEEQNLGFSPFLNIV